MKKKTKNYSIGVDIASGSDLTVRSFVTQVGHIIIPTVGINNTPRSIKGETMIVEDFLEFIISAACLKTSEGAPYWAKWIDSVDPTIKTGWCFVGEFINAGTVEVPLGKPKLILAQVSLADEKMKTGYLRQFRVLKMEADGQTLYATHISTDDRRGGWALRIRDHTANLLKDFCISHKPEGNRFQNVEVQE